MYLNRQLCCRRGAWGLRCAREPNHQPQRHISHHGMPVRYGRHRETIGDNVCRFGGMSRYTRVCFHSPSPAIQALVLAKSGTEHSSTLLRSNASSVHRLVQGVKGHDVEGVGGAVGLGQSAPAFWVPDISSEIVVHGGVRYGWMRGVVALTPYQGAYI